MVDAGLALPTSVTGGAEVDAADADGPAVVGAVTGRLPPWQPDSTRHPAAAPAARDDLIEK
jgi:hypothetical protein